MSLRIHILIIIRVWMRRLCLVWYGYMAYEVRGRDVNRSRGRYKNRVRVI